jgi:predicted acyl esterase
LPEDVQVPGPPRVTVYASIDQPDTKWRVEVREAGSDAIYPLASGWLKASHRALDDARTTSWEIAHDHTKEVPVVPGEINEFVVQLRPMSHLFKAGTQIKVEISSIDIPTDIETYDIMWHVCNATTTLHKIYRDGDHHSRVSLPVIPKRS